MVKIGIVYKRIKKNTLNSQTAQNILLNFNLNWRNKMSVFLFVQF